MDETTAPQSVEDAPAWTPVAGGFWLRGGAYMIDSLVVSIVGALVFFPAPAPVQTAGRILTAVAYFTFVPVLWNGRTLGKSAAGLAIVREDGGPLSHLTTVLRYVGYLLSLLPLGLGFFAAAFTKNKRALHDFVAGTRVLQIKEIGLTRRICVIALAILLPLVAVAGIAAGIAIPRYPHPQARAAAGAQEARR
ncbi:MAG: RDD family protein [Elusimicrobia bacterium]|nr:RDD family protein [Elusimicrobiota bacterium]